MIALGAYGDGADLANYGKAPSARFSASFAATTAKPAASYAARTIVAQRSALPASSVRRPRRAGGSGGGSGPAAAAAPAPADAADAASPAEAAPPPTAQTHSPPIVAGSPQVAPQPEPSSDAPSNSPASSTYYGATPGPLDASRKVAPPAAATRTSAPSPSSGPPWKLIVAGGAALVGLWLLHSKGVF